MIQIPHQAKVYTFPDYMSLEDPIEYHSSICRRNGFEFSGDIFAFKDYDQTHIGMLSYDGQGYEWCVKRFSKGIIPWWPSEEEIMQITARDLQIMLLGGNPKEINLPDLWRPIHKIE